MRQEPIDVAAALVFRAGKLLIAQRYPDVHLGGLWEFPGGKRQVNESFEVCLIRELQEELGIQVVVCDLLETITHRYPDKTVQIQFFRCRLVKNEPQPLACAAFAWIAPEDLQNYEFPAADARLIKRLGLEPELWITH